MPQVFVSIGSNIDRERNIHGAIAALTRRFGQLRLSTVYETAAVGFEGEPFFNLVVGFDTGESIETIRAELRHIEDVHGRQRGGQPKFSARTLDLDLILYGDVVDPAANLPHGDILKYPFVLGPLAELASDLVHPATGDSCLALWRKSFPDGGGLRRATFRP
jgi:2-amino-4-hydroxy-6-hydroxymethyldihydropteridine diphosphokinase